VTESPLHVLAVVGSLNSKSSTRAVVSHLAERLRARDCAVDECDLRREPLPLFDPESSRHAAAFPPLQARVERADVYVLGTPDYHGSISGALKNFLDHFWREFAGKLMASVVASHEKGLAVTDQLRTVARQCYAWSLPYGVAFEEKVDVQEGRVASPALRERLEMMAQDLRSYGLLLARQRRADLAGQTPGFLAHYRR
jgi:FMN reductase